MNTSRVELFPGAQPAGRLGDAVNAEPAPGAGAPPTLEECADRVMEAVPRTMRRIRTRTRAGSEPGLTVAQLRALLRVRHHSGGLGDLAGHLGVSAPAASALVERMVRAGLVDRAADPAERRRVLLRLTPTGEARVSTALAGTRAWLAGGLAALTPEERERLVEGLRLLDLVTRDRDDRR